MNIKIPPRGELTNGFLFISTISGIILLFQFDCSMPFESVVYINSILPFGWFFRNIHYWSSQLFVFLLIIHFFERIDILDRLNGKNWKELLKKLRFKDLSRLANDFSHWNILLFSLILSILVLFTGYVIRWDETGRFAGTIASEIIKSIPLVGNLLNKILMDVEFEGINKAFALHINITIILWGIGAWYHTRKVILGEKALFYSFVISITLSLIFSPSLKSPDIMMEYVTGPWFFVGIQELLRHLPVFWAGVVYPSIPILLLIAIFFVKDRRKIIYPLQIWGLTYLILSIIGFLR